MAVTTHLLYLHGFRSSPLSFKAVRIDAWLRAHRPEVRFWCPQLPPSPQQALRLVIDGTAGWPADRSAVIGSSLGGFYATVVADSVDQLVTALAKAVRPGDHVLVMSNGAFGGIHQKLLGTLGGAAR